MTVNKPSKRWKVEVSVGGVVHVVGVPCFSPSPQTIVRLVRYDLNGDGYITMEDMEHVVFLVKSLLSGCSVT